MCEATVYLEDKLILHDVMKIQVLPEGVRLTSMLESPLVMSATIREVDLTHHRVLLAPLPAHE